jgi:hypothetical protein
LFDSCNWIKKNDFIFLEDDLTFKNQFEKSKSKGNPASQKKFDNITEKSEINDIIEKSKILSPGAERLKNILKVCGELCNLNRPIKTPEPNYGYFGETTANINCKALFESPLLDEPSNLRHPPKLQSIPRQFLNYYSMNGKVDIQEWYIEDMFLGKKAKVSVWSEKLINDYASKALRGDFEGWGNYMPLDRITLFHVLQHVTQVRNQSVLVIGSESPWIEAMLVACGAEKVTTLEYGHIESHHPQVKTLTPNAFRVAYLNGTLEKFDAVVSYSSIEHSGLGRYGDSLNPFGDIMTLARAWCVTKKGGSLILGVSSSGEKDILYFNAGRIYGPNRWPFLTTNWIRSNFSSGWKNEAIEGGMRLPKRLTGPPGYKIFWNQSALVFHRSGPS